jgi:hypothetical protein
MSSSRWMTRIAVAFALAAIAAPAAQSTSFADRGTAALTPADVQRLGAQTEALGYLQLNRQVQQQGLTPAAVARLGAQTEAKGYLQLNRQVRPVLTPQTGSPTTGFSWGDAGIGAGITAALLVFGAAAGVPAMRRRTPAQQSS